MSVRVAARDAPGESGLPPIMAHETRDFCSFEHAEIGLKALGEQAAELRAQAIHEAKEAAARAKEAAEAEAAREAAAAGDGAAEEAA